MKALMVLCLLTTPVLAEPECLVITSGDLATYHHEVAHCNGWEHDPVNIPPNPPFSYDHPFKGKLIVTLAGGTLGLLVTYYAQKGTEFHYSDESPHNLCIKLLTAYNYYIPTDMELGMRRIGGCAVPLP